MSRRRCDLCDPERYVFLACSRACLVKHLRDGHGSAVEVDSYQRALAEVRRVNRQRTDAWTPYTSYREHLMRLVQEVPRHDGVCVLGAGNCDDLDLPFLVGAFGEVHLVDLDGDALARGIARTPEPVRRRIVTHAGIDLSGGLRLIDDWGERHPGAAGFGASALDSATAISGQIGRTFGAVLSTGLLSQLARPFRRALAMTVADWKGFTNALALGHLATMLRLMRAGAAAVLACDVASSVGAPVLAELATSFQTDDVAFASAVDALVRAGRVTLNPDPRTWIQLLESQPLAAQVAQPRLTAPWPWDLGGVRALVYGLLFSRL
ncbi:MAG TPA: hypothetical protein VMU50_05690 [Polyangia bacterium]|nr:hypothetical protein [Polyangia bacterium]